jgi:hypothetical protein
LEGNAPLEITPEEFYEIADAVLEEGNRDAPLRRVNGTVVQYIDYEGSRPLVEEIRKRVYNRHGATMTTEEVIDSLDYVNKINIALAREGAARRECSKIAKEISKLEEESSAIRAQRGAEPSHAHLKARVANLGRTLALWGRAERIAEPFPALHWDEDAAMRIEQLRATYVDVTAQLAAHEREETIHRRQAQRRPDPPLPARRCACGKPARLGDLCKKCARAAGVLDTGKV